MSESNIDSATIRPNKALPVKSSAEVERLAKALTIDLNDCIPTGNNGEVTEQDVDVAHALVSDKNRVNSIPILEEVIPEVEERESEYLDAEQLTSNQGFELSNSKLSIDLKVDELMACLQISQALEENETILLLDFIVKATAVALLSVPECNIQSSQTGLTKPASANIAVIRLLAVKKEVSVIESAVSKSVEEISKIRQKLSRKKKVVNLQQAELSECSIAIFDIGVQGIRLFEPAIGPCQCIVLGVGAAEPKAVVIGGGVGVATILTLTLSLNPQFITEVSGAKFLTTLQQVIETPTFVNT